MKNISALECIKILSNNYIGYLAYLHQKQSFVVPITYYYDKDDNSIISYSGEGQKIDAMRKNKQVSFEVTEIKSINNWQSILVQGIYNELEGSTAKYYLHEFAKGVKKLISEKDKDAVKFISEFSSKITSGKIPVVYRIQITDIIGKQRDS